ncbi:hypothetical protein EDB86DRAFT_3083168 [Lactarius hatsudake]|nr:hypothetical protein EDB86DRAFT_3083168 [Lactarius hatsudake]
MYDKLGKAHLYFSQSPPPVEPDGQAANAGADGEEQAVESELLFTENGTNFMRSSTDGHTTSIPHHNPRFVDPDKADTKSAARYAFKVADRGGYAAAQSKLTPTTPQKDATLEDESQFDDPIEERRIEAVEFYHSLTHGYTKQYYKFVAKEWLNGDPAQPPPPPPSPSIPRLDAPPCI